MAIRRREARCCVLLIFVILVVISSFMMSSDSLQPHFVDLSMPKIEIPSWLRPSKTATVSYDDVSEDTLEYPTKSISGPTSSPTGTARPLGPNDVGVETILSQRVHVPGFTVMDNLYLRNGTFFVLTSDASKFPDKADIIARPVLSDEYVIYEDRDSSVPPVMDQDLQFLEPSTMLLGQRAVRIAGLSVIVLDPPSTMDNVYSWWAEIVLGSWRVFWNATQDQQNRTDASIPLPSRFIIPMAEHGEWRDSASLNGPLMRVGLPNVSVEQADYWEDLERLDSTIIFARAILVSREAAARHPYYTRWFKMISGTMKLKVSTDFWEPIRATVVRNLLGYLPALDDAGALVYPSQEAVTAKPVVAYFFNQEGSSSSDDLRSSSIPASSGSRRLASPDHQGLVDALRALEDEGICQVRVLDVERAGLRDQIELAASSTVIVGVHGNALTNQLWMQASSKSSVVEILWPKAYIFDYEIVARNVGHKHFAVWNDTLVTYPEGTYHKGTSRPDGFNSDNIPVHGSRIAQFIRERLAPVTTQTTELSSLQ